ncbi:S8 family serine peptidase [Myceligenerans pegani]|uniref:S8 family serine peptidase n=1 Tax=Myceligenerans pegani TaxID=2776917 RepID=A0ABR9N565_9MICO|nr:S8 family serine peptidase [Myceligenerans sp. TRM 65318]MBE1878804.1 S8 family serine peptidase [Myceligenerans sp. TRM 65318]MBE3021075.1 S8 family serine peptidase [Myceligenerans sp. TRM 65318]
MHLTHLPARRRAAAALALAGLVATVGVVAQPAAARPPQPAHHQKLTAQVEHTLEETPRSDFWVRFSDKPDLSAAASVRDWGERGRAVVAALQDTAQASQADVVAELEAAGVGYESYWLTNAVLVRDGNLALAERLAAEPAVLQIRHTETFSTGDPAPGDEADTNRTDEDPNGAGTTDEATEPTASDAATEGPEWGVRSIGAPAVWSQGITGRGIVIANIDSGVEALHPTLAWSYRGTQPDGTIDNDYSFLDLTGECGGTPCDPHGHGTHTMGTIVGDDHQGNQVGVAPGARWIAANGCATCSDADLIASGEWILQPTRADGSDPDPAMRPHIVNNSWGTLIPSDNPWFSDIIRSWDAAGIFSVWSNGNNAAGGQCRTAGAPGSTPEAYSVGSYGEDGSIAWASSRGPGAGGETKPNIAAPGYLVRSSLPGGKYGILSGTSMAAPHVTGTVALLWSASPHLIGDIEGTKRLLDQTAADVEDTSCGGTAADNNVWGEGALNAAALIAATRGGTATATVSGAVSDADGEPLAARVLVDGPVDREIVAGADGRFSVDVTPGRYTVTATHHGHAGASSTVGVTDAGATADLSLAATPTETVSGRIEDATGRSLDAATVTLLADDARPAAATTSQGRFALTAPRGNYLARVTADLCVGTDTTLVHVDGPESLQSVVDNAIDTAGYMCTGGQDGYRTGNQVLIPGDDEWADEGDKKLTPLRLPFTFPFYNGTYRTAYVSSNGYISFQDGLSDPYANGMPSLNGPNAALYAYWTNLHLGDDAGVYTRRTTVEGTPAVVVEWRNVGYGNGSEPGRVSFSATLRADGTVTVAFGDLPRSPSLRGLGGIIGTENETGTAGLRQEYGLDDDGVEVLLRSGQTIEFSRPPVTYVTGTVTDRNDGKPVENAKVRVTADGEQAAPEVRTAADGSYTVAVPVGRATVGVEARGYRTESTAVRSRRPSTRADRWSPSLATGVVTVVSRGKRPPELRLTSRDGAPAHETITVRNTGSAALTLEAGAMAPAGEPAAPGGRHDGYRVGQQGPGADHGDDRTGRHASGTAAEFDRGIGLRPQLPLPDTVGVVTGGWDTALSRTSAVGYGDDEVWVTDLVNRVFQVYDREGTPLRQVDASALGNGGRDLAYDSATDRMCQVHDAYGIVCLDEDGSVAATLSHPSWRVVPWSSLAYDEEGDVFYISDTNQRAILAIAGTTHPVPGDQLGWCETDHAGLQTLAFNQTSNTLWAGYYYEHGIQAALAIDPADCSVQRSVQISGSSFDTDRSGSLWVIRLTPVPGSRDPLTSLDLTDLDDPQFDRVDGLTITAPTVIRPGRTATVHVRYDTDDERGRDRRTSDRSVQRQELDLALHSDAGRRPLVRVPMVLTTESGGGRHRH